MGINIHVYSYWGVRTEYNEEFSTAYEEVYSENVKKYGHSKEPEDAQIDVLFDGMSGEYIVFGVELYDSGDSRWGEMYNANEVDISPEKMEALRLDYLEKFKRLYPDQYEWFAAKPWRLVNLVHYS